ncbi:MAG: TlpA family protein disulfide reductase [Anaerolineales bacterium]|nr:TlpA family protein disulfide reductase [Anaerolineales bacterium]
MRAFKLIGLLLLGMALGAGAGAALWYAPGAAATPASPLALGTTPLTAAPAPVVDAPAPDFSLPGLDGKTAALADLRGKIVILNFWATWCGPCREELPLLESIARTHASSLTVLAVETGDPADAVRAFTDALGLERVRILLDPSGGVGDLYLVRGLPTTFFIDETGMIRRIKIGTLDPAEMESILAQLGAAL